MKIIDTSRVDLSDEGSIKILLLKLMLEDSGIDQWIFSENLYSFSGVQKGFVLNTLLETDERFVPYKDKIKVIEIEYDSKMNEASDRNAKMNCAWRAEQALKDAPLDYILSTHSDDTWVAVADADEIIDFTDARRTQIVYDTLNNVDKANPAFLAMVRYWYDFDNFSFWRGYPLITVGRMRSLNKIEHAYPEGTHNMIEGRDFKEAVAFEYSSCFDIDTCLSKLKNSPFYYFERSDFERAFECNYWPAAAAVGESPSRFFEIIELNEYNSPQYVRENLLSLKTNNISPNYRENRNRL